MILDNNVFMLRIKIPHIKFLHKHNCLYRSLKFNTKGKVIRKILYNNWEPDEEMAPNPFRENALMSMLFTVYQCNFIY